jgi:hypothetical protein
VDAAGRVPAHRIPELPPPGDRLVGLRGVGPAHFPGHEEGCVTTGVSRLRLAHSTHGGAVVPGREGIVRGNAPADGQRAQLLRRGGHVVAPGREERPHLLERMEDDTHHEHRADGVRLEFDRGDDAQVATRAAHGQKSSSFSVGLALRSRPSRAGEGDRREGRRRMGRRAVRRGAVQDGTRGGTGAWAPRPRHGPRSNPAGEMISRMRHASVSPTPRPRGRFSATRCSRPGPATWSSGPAGVHVCPAAAWRTGDDR